MCLRKNTLRKVLTSMTKEYVFNLKPNYNIIFHRGNTQIGVLDFNGPEMTFSGDMDESAILFIEVIANSFKARLEQERAEEREACAKQLDALGCDHCANAIRTRGSHD